MVNESLPIFAYRDEIVRAVAENSVVIIEAETGAGKSTQVPQFLLEDGWSMVVTEPRVLAARTLSARVAEEIGDELGGVVGYRTAYERSDSSHTRALFCTDGLALVRELMGAGDHQILILDEVHEWNLNIEVLLAWAKLQIDSGAPFKLVIMSATLESDKLSDFFDGAPVVSVPGRLFPVEEQSPSRQKIEDIVALLQKGRNVLVFEPGKAEIYKLIRELTELGIHAEILPLHGELSPEDQAKCFKHYYRPKCVVATTVAQTSVTIDDIDAVVDSGMERRIELVDGVEGLYLKSISLSDRKQRMGRAGRTRPGIYIDHCDTFETRPEFPVAEILRTRLDQTVLRLAMAGIDAEELSFFHQPPRDQIHEARRALRVLGLMDEVGVVTDHGRRVSRLPISVQAGRMLIEAERLGVTEDMLTIIAILEQGAITARKDERGSDAAYLWKQLCPGEKESDLLAQLAVYQAAEGMSKGEMIEKGVFAKAFFKAKQKRKHLADALKGRFELSSSGGREEIMKAIVAGMIDHLFRRGAFGRYSNGDYQVRQLDRKSVVPMEDFLVGKPFDLQIKTRFGELLTLNLITMATAVKPEWLPEIAPQLVSKENLTDWDKSVVEVTSFNGVEISRKTIKESPLLSDRYRDPWTSPNPRRVPLEEIEEDTLPKEETPEGGEFTLDDLVNKKW